MKNSFDANVPRRRPRGGRKKPATQASAEPVEGKQGTQDKPAAKHEIATGLADTTRQIVQKIKARIDQADEGQDVLTRGRQRVAQLKKRLDQVSTSPSDAREAKPRDTTEAARAFIHDHRARLESLSAERDALEQSLTDTRAELQGVQAELEIRSRALQTAEAASAEHARLAEELVCEAEFLASERDQAFMRIAELRELGEQQTRLLVEAESALAERDQRLEQAQAHQRVKQASIEEQATEIENLGARLARRTAERDELADRVSRLETDLQSGMESREALAEIRRLVEASS